MEKPKPKKQRPAQHQARPGTEAKMKPEPVSEKQGTPGSGKLQDKVAFITGGDSGIGKAVAILFAKEGAHVAIVYLSEHEDARETAREVEKYGRKCLLISGDLGNEDFCKDAVKQAIHAYGRINVLVNNAALHWEREGLEDISTEQLLRTFSVNIFAMFWITKAALEHMDKGSAIINTASVTAYRGSDKLIDYAATKSAIVGFTRSLSANLVGKGIRVNGVAPGPIWTPLITSSFDPDHVAKFGSETPMKRAGEPAEVAPAYLFLACDDSSYITGQFIHPNGGEIING